MPLEMIEHDLNALKPFMRFGMVQILGGEPLLHPRIVDVIRLVKRIRLDRQTLIITNGGLLHRMPEDFWRELEQLQISVYDGKANNLELAERKSKEYGFALFSTRFESFHRQLKPVPDDGVKSFEGCHWKSDCFTIHRGHAFLCSQSCFFPKAIMGLTAAIDGLPLEGLTEEKLQAFLNRTEPFNACKLCRANEMKTEPWREVSKRSEWIKESMT